MVIFQKVGDIVFPVAYVSLPTIAMKFSEK